MPLNRVATRILEYIGLGPRARTWADMSSRERITTVIFVLSAVIAAPAGEFISRHMAPHHGVLRLGLTIVVGGMIISVAIGAFSGCSLAFTALANRVKSRR